MSLPTAEQTPPPSPRRRLSPAQALSWISVFAFVGLVVLFLWQAGTFVNLVPQEAPAPAKVETPNQANMTAARYVGNDKNRQPYWVEAKSALQDDKNPNRVHLDTVSGELQREGGDRIRVDANSATYDREAQYLDLQGSVTVVSPDNYTLTTDKARVNLEDKMVRTTQPVAVKLQNGDIQANGMKITDDGDRILFFNGVRAHFNSAGNP